MTNVQVELCVEVVSWLLGELFLCEVFLLGPREQILLLLGSTMFHNLNIK
jgi:hypothetical protein